MPREGTMRRLILVLALALGIPSLTGAQADRTCRLGTELSINPNRAVLPDEQLFTTDSARMVVITQRQAKGSFRIVEVRCKLPPGTKYYCSRRGCWVQICGQDFRAEGWNPAPSLFLALQGPPGKDGTSGRDGKNGRDGQNGADGRDAPPLNIDYSKMKSGSSNTGAFVVAGLAVAALGVVAYKAIDSRDDSPPPPPEPEGPGVTTDTVSQRPKPCQNTGDTGCPSPGISASIASWDGPRIGVSRAGFIPQPAGKGASFALSFTGARVKFSVPIKLN